MSNEYDPIEFIEGQRACREGYPTTGAESVSFLAGYSAEYQLTEINSKQAELSWG